MKTLGTHLAPSIGCASQRGEGGKAARSPESCISERGEQMHFVQSGLNRRSGIGSSVPRVRRPRRLGFVALATTITFSTAGAGVVLSATSAWGSGWTPTEAPLPAGANSSPSADVTGVACPTAGSCVAVGSYTDASSNDQGVIDTLSGGVWTATKAPLPANASPDAILSAVACTSATACTAAGQYIDNSGHDQGLIETGSGTSWTATEAPLPAGANANPVVSIYILAVGCTSATACTIVGEYADNSGNQQGLIETGSGTSWTPTKAPLPAGANANSGADLYAVACTSATACTAAGQYNDNSGQQGLIETGSGTSWTPTKAPLPAGANANPVVSLSAVRCTSATACTIVSGYYDILRQPTGTDRDRVGDELDAHQGTAAGRCQRQPKCRPQRRGVHVGHRLRRCGLLHRHLL